MTTASSTAPTAAPSCATCATRSRGGSTRTSGAPAGEAEASPMRPLTAAGDASASAARFVDAGLVPYAKALELQRTLAAAVLDGGPETVILVEHPPVVTTGRRTELAKELHIPTGTAVELVETDRGGKSTYHAPGQLVCYPILDLTRHGKDVRRYCRDLEEALIRTMRPLGVDATRIEGLTGIWLERPPRKIASIGIHISKWVTTH